MGKWKAADFWRASGEGPQEQSGWAYRGLGVYDDFFGEEWCIIHLNTGLAVAWAAGSKQAALRMATKLAECADWTFQNLADWRESDPDLSFKVQGQIDASNGKMWRKNNAADHRELARSVSKAVFQERSKAAAP